PPTNRSVQRSRHAQPVRRRSSLAQSKPLRGRRRRGWDTRTGRLFELRATWLFLSAVQLDDLPVHLDGARAGDRDATLVDLNLGASRLEHDLRCVDLDELFPDEVDRRSRAVVEGVR